MAGEEWTLPGALKDLTDAVKGLSQITSSLDALTAEIKHVEELLPKISSNILASLLEEGGRNRKVLGDAVQEILKTIREAVEELKTKPIPVGGE